ncbi:MAG: methionine synthase [Lachnospiraceae bacterium]|nr:methionine synthase [Lachnospiraceae bacterium]
MKKTNIRLDKVNRDELYRYVGTPDDNVRGIIDECETELIELVKPGFVWKLFEIEFDDSGVRVLGTDIVLTGNSIKKHLDGCNKLAMLAVTLSSEADKLIRKYQISNMAKAVVMDAIASVAVEQVCNIAEEDIKQYLPNMYFTYRFGVGYGDLPLELEKDILEVLQGSKTIGLCATDANILTPLKSVVCVIGISENPMEKGQKGCTTCNMKDTCKYRRQGLNCAY